MVRYKSVVLGNSRGVSTNIQLLACHWEGRWLGGWKDEVVGKIGDHGLPMVAWALTRGVVLLRDMRLTQMRLSHNIHEISRNVHRISYDVHRVSHNIRDRWPNARDTDWMRFSVSLMTTLNWILTLVGSIYEWLPRLGCKGPCYLMVWIPLIQRSGLR